MITTTYSVWSLMIDSLMLVALFGTIRLVRINELKLKEIKGGK